MSHPYPCKLEPIHGKMQSICSEPPKIKTLDQAEKLKTPQQAKPLKDKFVPHSPSKTNPRKDSNSLENAPEIHEYDLGLKQKGEFVAIHVVEATGPRGAEFLKTHQSKLGLALVERENGIRMFVPKGQSAGFRAISPQQQTLEANGSLQRSSVENTVIYQAKNAAGERFLKKHPELNS